MTAADGAYTSCGEVPPRDLTAEDPCWLCGGLGGIAMDYDLANKLRRLLWFSHAPGRCKEHTVHWCPVCRADAVGDSNA